MTAATLQNRANQVTFQREAERFLTTALFPPEFHLLRLYKHRWQETDMLDLGVGAGRTALTFANLARSYVGLDYAPRMIDLCRAHVGESESVQFVVGDATDLSAFHGRRFGLVLFSFNGLDCIDHEGRLKVLGEVRKVLSDDGRFFFSAHSLCVYPLRLKWPRKGGDSLARWAWRCGRRLEWFVKQKWANRHLRIEEVRQRGWALIADGDPGFNSRWLYILPELQVRQLSEAGFDVEAVYDKAGKPIDWRQPPGDSWFHYLCRSRGG
jgi:SAM-dependent methyltransferase